MRSCEDFELLMNLCLDDMLPSEEQESLREHLEACPACRERFAQLREMKAALADMEVPVPAELHERIMGYVAENTAQIPDETNVPAKVLRPRRWYRGLATVAACAVIAVAAAQFVPNVQHKSAESLAAAPQTPGVSFDSAGIESESATNNKMEFFDSTEVPAAPPMSMAQPEAGEIPSTPAEPSLNMQPTGQLAEDLPPLRQETAGDETAKDASILKWLPRSFMKPNWTAKPSLMWKSPSRPRTIGQTSFPPADFRWKRWKARIFPPTVNISFCSSSGQNNHHSKPLRFSGGVLVYLGIAGKD